MLKMFRLFRCICQCPRCCRLCLILRRGCKRFSNEESTSIFTTRLSSAYNDYMGEYDISKKLIVKTVTNVDNVGKMVISIEGGKFIDKMAPLVMLDDTMTQSGADEMQKYYEKNGFTCSVDEQDMVLSE